MLKDLHAHPRDQRIVFQEDGHLYTISGLPKHPISVTTAIHRFFPVFDADQVIDKMMASYKWPNSKYFGMSKPEIKRLWETDGKNASSLGTAMHHSIEMFINTGQTPTQITPEFQLFLKFWQALRTGTPQFFPYRTEWLIFDEEAQIAGSIDLALANEQGDLILLDWKRSKEIKMVNEYQKGFGCFSHLDDCNYNHYTLQLNCYRHILEKCYGKQVVGMFLVILHPNNENFVLIPVNRWEREMEDFWRDLVGQKVMPGH